jgi:molybdate transport system substrate-binding protein
LGFLAARGLPGQAPPVTVFAAASLTEAFTELGRRYQDAPGGGKVLFNFAGSQQLAAQLDQGARADVFASADQRWMDHVRDAGLLVGAPIVFARNRLVVILPAGNPGRVERLPDLARRGLKLVLAAASVPVGKYSREALGRLADQPGFEPDFASRVLANLVSEEENVKAVAAKVQLGEADAGMVYHSDLTPSVARRVRVIELPEQANVVAEYPIALLKTAPDSAAARAFIDLVLSRRGQEVLRTYGFEAGSGQ